MQKKSILILLIIVIMVAVIGYLGYNQFGGTDNQVKVGEATFTLPEGFHIGTPNNKNRDTNVTNGYDTVFIKYCGKDNITKYVNKYVDGMEENNTFKVNIKNLTMNDTVIYKSSIQNNTLSVHYWFEHNGKVYSIYSWSANNNLEKIVTDLISSVK